MINVIVMNSEKIYKESFGLWLSGLFSSVCGNNPHMSFEEKKQAFFELLNLWLIEGKIVFCEPSDPLTTVWNTDVDTIVNYLKTHWPAVASDEKDLNLNLFFFEMPAVLWVGDDGQLHGS